MGVKYTLAVAFLATALPLSFSLSAAPPLFGTSLFECNQRDLVFSDYVKKTRNVIEVCKGRNTFTLTYGRYEDPSRRQLFTFKETEVEITDNNIILKGRPLTYQLQFTSYGEGTLSTVIENKYANIIETFDIDSPYLLNNIKQFIPKPTK